MKTVLLSILLLSGQFASAAIGAWSGEGAYLRCNPDVQRAVYSGATTARRHYQQFGQYENRIIDGSCFASDAPYWFNENQYLRCNRDVADAVIYRHDFLSGWAHYRLHGQMEGRQINCP